MISVGLALLMACAQRTPVAAPPLAAEPLPELGKPEYRLQPRDMVAIRFWGNPELNEEQRIRPDGRISLPFIDEVPAAGLTPRELDDVLTVKYAAELARPDLTVIVREAALPQIFVGGEVTFQGIVPLTDNLTLFRAVQRAGGFKTTARRKDVLLIRRLPDGTSIARKIDIRPIMSGADPNADVVLAANDIVFVPRTKIESGYLFMNQYVDKIIPLQNVFGGLLLGTLASDDEPATTGGTGTGGGGR